MFELTDLKASMAACWKVSWKVDPLPLSVPLPAVAPVAAPAGVVPARVVPAGGGAGDEHAARASAAMTALPVAATHVLPRNSIRKLSFCFRTLLPLCSALSVAAIIFLANPDTRRLLVRPLLTLCVWHSTLRQGASI